MLDTIQSPIVCYRYFFSNHKLIFHIYFCTPILPFLHDLQLFSSLDLFLIDVNLQFCLTFQFPYLLNSIAQAFFISILEGLELVYCFPQERIVLVNYWSIAQLIIVDLKFAKK